MKIPSGRERRGAAWMAAKLAVREYSRDPSKSNETLVRAACLRLRETARLKATMSKGPVGEVEAS